jgi:putative molybdopterin biosynthesis protein
VRPADAGRRPLPQFAYQRWLDGLTGAGWSPPPSMDSGQRAPGAGSAERVAVGEALGRVTAGPVTARWPSPRAACAAMDGIAVLAADLGCADHFGSEPGTVRLPAGRFQWIDTGDPMPDGADTVVIRERLRPQPDGAVLVGLARGAVAGRDVRPAGEDFQAGEVLVPGGRRLRPGDLAAVAAGGHATVAVLRRPAVAIIPTGDEIRPVGSELQHGDITDSNSVMLAARCRQLAALPSVSDVVPDDPDALAAALGLAAAKADLVLVIAGSSRGRGDHAAAVLAQVGGVAVAGVAVRPGHPALLGHAKRPAGRDGEPAASRAGIAPVIGLPGYPLAAAVVFELFAAPMLAALGARAIAPDRVRARLDRDWDSPADVEEWVLVTLRPGGGVPVATPARRGAGSVSQLARSDAWWPVPGGTGNVARGTEIEVIPVDRSC